MRARCSLCLCPGAAALGGGRPVLRRPGILCLINDVDWELEGKLEYVVQEGDCITFISTLHGG